MGTGEVCGEKWFKNTRRPREGQRQKKKVRCRKRPGQTSFCEPTKKRTAWNDQCDRAQAQDGQFLLLNGKYQKKKKKTEGEKGKTPVKGKAKKKNVQTGGCDKRHGETTWSKPGRRKRNRGGAIRKKKKESLPKGGKRTRAREVETSLTTQGYVETLKSTMKQKKK